MPQIVLSKETWAVINALKAELGYGYTMEDAIKDLIATKREYNRLKDIEETNPERAASWEDEVE